MGFIEGFVNFELNISNSIRETYDSQKIRIAKHPLEEIEHLCARLLCFAHAYREGIDFSVHPNSADSPSLVNIDASGAVKQWCHVGKLNSSSLRHAVKHNKQAEIECYFYKEQQLDNFCHQLRGAKTNWVDNVVFWKIGQELLDRTTETLEARNNWMINIVDEQVYITTNNSEFSGSIYRSDIWRDYQEHLSDAS